MPDENEEKMRREDGIRTRITTVLLHVYFSILKEEEEEQETHTGWPKEDVCDRSKENTIQGKMRVGNSEKGKEDGQ